MTYRVITYRSRRLAKNTIIIDEITAGGSAVISDYEDNDLNEEYYAADGVDVDAKLTRKEKRAQKKQLKKMRKESKNMVAIGKEEINKDDYNPEEIEDFQASAQFNKDGFYDALEPIDANEERKKESNSMKKIIIGVPIAFILLGILIFVVYWVYMQN